MSSPTRRLRLRAVLWLLTIGLSLLAGISFAGEREDAPPQKSQPALPASGFPKPIRNDGGQYPILFEGEQIEVGITTNRSGRFSPLFSPNRSIVNPGKPAVTRIGSKTLMTFDSPGEYYINYGKDSRSHLKVLVLSRAAPISENVLRIFDFLVANMLVAQGQDSLYYADPAVYTKRFFSSKAPGLLLCGPTLAMFADIIRDRFALPVRDVTFTGTYLEEGRIGYSTHNVLEIYLPDLKKWVLFDVNNGFMSKWLDAFEVAAAARRAATSKLTFTPSDMARLDIDLHHDVAPMQSRNPADLRPEFGPDMVTKHKVRDNWARMFRIFFSGPGYWAGSRFGQPGGLPGNFDLYEARFHEDPLLLAAQKRWAENWNLKVAQDPPNELRAALDAAYAEIIDARLWSKHIAASAPDR